MFPTATLLPPTPAVAVSSGESFELSTRSRRGRIAIIDRWPAEKKINLLGESRDHFGGNAWESLGT